MKFGKVFENQLFWRRECCVCIRTPIARIMALTVSAKFSRVLFIWCFDSYVSIRCYEKFLHFFQEEWIPRYFYGQFWQVLLFTSPNTSQSAKSLHKDHGNPLEISHPFVHGCALCHFPAPTIIFWCSEIGRTIQSVIPTVNVDYAWSNIVKSYRCLAEQKAREENLSIKCSL